MLHMQLAIDLAIQIVDIMTFAWIAISYSYTGTSTPDISYAMDLSFMKNQQMES